MIKNFYIEQQGDSRSIVYKITNDDLLDTFGLEILRRNKVEGLLTCSISQLNNERALKYNIGIMPTLIEILNHPITEEKLLELLLSITRTFNLMEDYMLAQSQIVLDPAFIFVDLDKGKSGLIYSPIELINEELKSFSRFIKEILLDLKVENQSDHNLANKIYIYLSENWNLSVKSFGEFLEDHKVKEFMMSEIDITEMNTDYHDNSIQENNHFTPELPSFSIPKDVYSPQTTIQQTVNKKKEPKVNEKKNNKNLLFSIFKKKSKVSNDREYSSFHTVLNQTINSGKSEVSQIYPSAFPQQQNHLNTEIGTSILNMEMESGTTVLSSVKHPYILRHKTGERFYLNRTKQNIGSDKKKVDFFINYNPAISRCHATFTKKKDLVYVQDEGSTNGTFMNGSKLNKGSLEKLKQGDSITLANEIFEFKTY
ncbi:MAG: hypothetical protein K0R18_809 [Bacillales bacterium]|jgi:hypothetical protein|nr:hypothetical protein [Bacillales bacterium]